MSQRIGEKLGSGRTPTRNKIRKAAQMVAEGEPVFKAMKMVGYSEKTADRRPSALTSKPEFQEELAAAKAQIAEACQRHNVTIDRMVKKASEGLEATKPMSGVGGMFLKLKGGEVDDMGHGNMMIPDNDAQVKWWDRCAILLGIKKDDIEDKGLRPVTINAIMLMVTEARRSRGLEI